MTLFFYLFPFDTIIVHGVLSLAGGNIGSLQRRRGQAGGFSKLFDMGGSFIATAAVALMAFSFLFPVWIELGCRDEERRKEGKMMRSFGT